MYELEIALVVLLILLNGAFALSELAVVSSRQRRLQSMAEEGRAGARTALALATDPGRFLSTVQIGITLVGILAGAFSGETLGTRLAEVFREHGMPASIANPLGFGVVVASVTYFSIVIGELVPKRLALRNPEAIACTVAPAMSLISRIAGPAVWLLDASTRGVFRLLRVGPAKASVVTDEEIRSVIAEAEGSGTIEPGERHLIAGVMRLGDRLVLGVMTPRTEVEWLDLSADEADILQKLTTTRYSRLPVGEGSRDALTGVVQTRALLARALSGQPLDVRAHVEVAPVIPDTADALTALDVLRMAAVPVALIHDEYGHFEGLVTPADLLEAIAGTFGNGVTEPGSVRRDDGSWLLSGWLPADEMAELLGLRLATERDYQTTAGFILSALRRLPKVADHIDIGDWRFEVMDMDGNRIDKILATQFQGVPVVAPLHRAGSPSGAERLVGSDKPAGG